MADETSKFKACDLCGCVAPAEIVTCPNDGEASWSQCAPTAKLEPEPEPAPAKGKRK